MQTWHRLWALTQNRVRALQAFHVMRQGATLLIAIALPRLVDKEIIGEYELFFYLAYLLVFAWTTGLIQALLALFSKLTPLRQRRLLVMAVGVFTAIGTVVCTVAYACQDWLVPLLTGRDELALFGWFLLYLALHIPTLLLENIYLLLERSRSLWLYALVVGGGFVVAVLLPLYLGFGLLGALQGMIIYAALRYGWLVAVAIRYGNWSFDARLLRQWGWLALPLMVYAVLGAINTSIDSWLVGRWYAGDMDVFATFRYGARELPFVTALTAALGNAMLPVLSQGKAQGLLQLRQRSLCLYHLIFPLTTVLLLTNQYWFTRVFSAAFAESIPLFNTFLLITASRLLFGQSVLIAVGGQKVLPYFVALGIVCNLVVSYLLLARIGLIGVAVGTVVAYAFEKGLTTWWVGYKYRIAFAQYTPIGWWLFYSLVLLVAYGLDMLW